MFAQPLCKPVENCDYSRLTIVIHNVVNILFHSIVDSIARALWGCGFAKKARRKNSSGGLCVVLVQDIFMRQPKGSSFSPYWI